MISLSTSVVSTYRFGKREMKILSYDKGGIAFGFCIIIENFTVGIPDFF